MNEWKDWPIQSATEDQLKKVFGRVVVKLPTKLYYRGKWDDEIFLKTITIVGSRRMTRYGEDVTKRMVPELAMRKITVISGMMYGIDSAAHRQAIESGGKTVAIVGGGLDMMANSYNQQLYSDILKHGGVVMSEYESGFMPTRWSFPQRDRLMAAMASLGVLVIEAGLNSGSLITADYAIKYKKELFAVPGPINSKVSEGTNWLIKTGKAKFVESVGDILNDHNNPVQEEMFKDYSGLVPVEKKIIDILESEALTVDEVSRKIKISIIDTATAISMLSLRGLVEEKDGKIYLG